MTQRWQRREISNFEYLIFLNTISGKHTTQHLCDVIADCGTDLPTEEMYTNQTFRSNFEIVLLVLDPMICVIFATFSFLTFFNSTRSDL